MLYIQCVVTFKEKLTVMSKIIAFQTYLLSLHAKCTVATESRNSKDRKRAIRMINFFMAGIIMYALCEFRYIYN